MFRRRIEGSDAGRGDRLGQGLRGLGIALVASLAPAGPASAQFSLEPDWARRPNAEEISREYPKLALALGIEGRVILSCDVTAVGNLKSCSVQKEAPGGFGFAAAALRMSRSFEMRPGIGLSRRAPHGDVRIPIDFKLPPLETPPAALPLSASGKALAARLVTNADPTPGFLTYYDTEAEKLEKGLPGVPPEAGVEAAKALRAAARAKAPGLRQAFGEAMAARLGDAELRDFVAFAESDTGRRWFAVDPTLRDRQMRLAREQQQRIRVEAHRILCRNRECASMAPGSTLVLDGGAAEPDPNAPLPYVPWSQRPTVTDTLGAWPISSLFGIAGYAVSTCTLGLLGAPEDCELAHESPKDLGVGSAAQRLTERYRVTPEFLATGVGKRVLIFAYFPSGPPPLTPTAAPPSLSPTRLALARRVAELQFQRFGDARDKAELAALKTRLAPLEPGLQREAEAALVAARDAVRPEFSEAQARLTAELYSEEDLRRIVRFEEGLGPAIQRAAKASEPELILVSRLVGDQVSAAARESFCKTRDCTPSPPQPTAANPEPSTRNP